MRLFWSELRGAPSRWLVPALIVTTLLLLSYDSSWQAGFPDVSAALVGTTAVSSSVAAGAAAFLAATRSSRPTRALDATGVRRQWEINSLLMGTVFVHALVGVALGAVYPMVRVVMTGAPGTLSWGYIGAAIGYIALGVGTGTVAGRLIPWAFITPPTVLILFFLYVATLSPPVTGPPMLRPAPAATAVFVACAAAVVVVASWARGWSRRTMDVLRCVPGLLVATVLLYATTTAGALQEARPPAPGVCSDDGRICVWPEHAHHLGELSAAVGRLDPYSASGLAIRSTMTQQGLADSTAVFTFPPSWFASAAMVS